MTNEIISGVAIKLAEMFGDEYEIYKNELRQGLKKPCFFVLALNPFRTPYLCSRMKITIPLDVHFFPVDETNNDSMMRVGDKLFDVLEHIVTPKGDGFRGQNMNYRIEDGVLHFFVTYTAILNRFEDKEKMGNLVVKERMTRSMKI